MAEFAPAVAFVRRFAAEHALSVHKVDCTRRSVALTGMVDKVAAAFGTTIRSYEHKGKHFLGRSGALTVPGDLAPWTRAVLGLDQRLLGCLMAQSGSSGSAGLWPTELAALYGVPLDTDAAGQCVGIVALGGGYQEGDFAAAAAGMGRSMPEVVERSVGGAVHQWEGGSPADEELALDLQVLAGLVPGARIVIYFAGNHIENVAAAIQEAVFDNINSPKVLTFSWGSAEKFWHADIRQATEAALADAVRLGVTVVVAAGDLLATGGLLDGRAHVFYPASSPYVLACGGTRPSISTSGLESEEVWNDGGTGTGGGISEIFPVPSFQSNVVLPASANGGGRGRGVPDVAAAAAGNPGYRVVLGGREIVKDGTSAVAPLWAGLIALANARRGTPVGFVNPQLYADPTLFRPVVAGNNRVNGVGYDAGLGWNACTGLGTPKGAEVLAALAAIPMV
ncbi:MAG: S53 family peptidase [Propylenella sp.]